MSFKLFISIKRIVRHIDNRDVMEVNMRFSQLKIRKNIKIEQFCHFPNLQNCMLPSIIVDLIKMFDYFILYIFLKS